MNSATTSSVGLAPYDGPWTLEHRIHLLRRTAFGVNFQDILSFQNLDLNSCLDIILSPQPEPPPPVNDYETVLNDYTGVVPGQTWVKAIRGSADLEGQRMNSHYRSFHSRMLNDSGAFMEKLTLFWQNHFAVQFETVKDSRFMYEFYRTIRTNALGNFKALVKAITLDPAMLVCLNGELNNKYSPDENYARELQELFTIGKGTNARYSEEDIRQAAKVLTGWKAHIFLIEKFYYDEDHDYSDKQFSEYYGNTIIKGDKGDIELDALLTMIFLKQDVSEYICSKLYRWYVYYEIDEQVQNNIIIPLAKIFRDNDYEILPVLKTLFKSAHFFDALNMGCQIKNPYDFSIGLYRLLKPGINDLNEFSDNGLSLIADLLQMQMLAYHPPNIAGWPAYSQSPAYYQLWLNSSTIESRNKLISKVLNNSGFNILSFISFFPSPEDVDYLISTFNSLLFPPNLDDSVKNTAKSILLTGQSNSLYWTKAWNDYKTNPDNEITKNTVLVRLRAFLEYLFSQPNYFLC